MPHYASSHNRLQFDIALSQVRYTDPTKLAFLNRLLPELAALPGVERVSAADPPPILMAWARLTNFTIANHPSSPDNPPWAVGTVAMPGYFETLSIPLVRGRTFTAYDKRSKFRARGNHQPGIGEAILPG